MIKKIIQFVAAFLCGYVFCNWMPVSKPFAIPEFLLELILNPLRFFAASVALLAGITITSRLIKQAAFWKTGGNRRKKSYSSLLFTAIGFIFILFLLFPFGAPQTVVFLGISLIYGMISIDFSR